MTSQPSVAGAPVVSDQPMHVDFDVEALLGDAASMAGADDPGDDSFLEPLQIVCEAFEREAGLSPQGRVAAHGGLVGMLARRMMLTADAAKEPDILEEKVRQPIVITGLPRTGTTLLHGLLACDPAARAPLQWEVDMPSPPPGPPPWDDDPRPQLSREIYGQLNQAQTLLAAAHPMGADLPAECINIFDISLRSMSFPSIYHVPTYLDWLLESDPGPALAAHRRLLQQLQWGAPERRWVLKAPAHMAAAGALWDVYPEVGVVHLHRDPATVFPSVASLLSLFRGMYTGPVDKAALGPEMVEVWGRPLERFLETRDARGSDGVVDIRYGDLLADPISAVARVYDRFNLRLTGEAESGMRAYLAANPQDKHGTHRYTANEFGLDPGALRERFSTYIDRFDIPTEGT